MKFAQVNSVRTLHYWYKLTGDEQYDKNESIGIGTCECDIKECITMIVN